MADYRQYFEDNEKLLYELERLHKKKKALSMILEGKEINPYVVELCGLPRTGKTTSLERIYDFFKFGGITIEQAEEPAFLIKKSMSLKELSKLSNLEFNDKTLEFSRKSLKEAKKKNPSIILMDRGIIDNYFWYQMMYDEGVINEETFIQKTCKIEKDLELINKLFVMTANSHTIIRRDYINSLYLEDRKKTTIEKVTKLKQACEEYGITIKRKSNKMENIDTTDKNEQAISILLADKIMDSMMDEVAKNNNPKTYELTK